MSIKSDMLKDINDFDNKDLEKYYLYRYRLLKSDHVGKFSDIKITSYTT